MNEREYYIKGGKRGFLVAPDPQDLRRAFSITGVHVSVEE